jgi:glycosyltransferase involved in cell wall biosynthesis
LLPLIIAKKIAFGKKIIICPRGMMQKGALQNGHLKKTTYIRILNKTALLKKVEWHANNKEEEEDIIRNFGAKSKVHVILNIPKRPLGFYNCPDKNANSLKLVYLSLISEKKNLLLLIRVLHQLSAAISLDIYGPVKDKGYWKTCLAEITGVAERISYKGVVDPQQVQSVLLNYDAMILLTKGENFGHAIYEALSVGCPVITSNYTPWKNLQQLQAGWNVAIENPIGIQEKLKEIAMMPVSEFQRFRSGAHQLAVKYYEEAVDIKGYEKMFDIDE